MKCRTLYRPIAWKELELIAESGWKRFPPRLEWQPIFYPVLNQSYAEQIAREWNTEDAFSGYCGVVTAFDVEEAFLSRYDIQNVGGQGHDELWVPAEELEAFNQHIDGPIRIVAAFFGSQYSEDRDSSLVAVLEKYMR